MSVPDVVRYFSQHFVNIGWIDATPNAWPPPFQKIGKPFLASGFIMSVGRYWYLITAGHVLEDIEAARQKGQVLKEWCLDDTWGHGSKWDHRIPFDFDGTPKLHIDIPGYDYAAILLRPMYQQLLSKNGVRPITEQAWKVDLSEKFDDYFILGTPEEFFTPVLTASGFEMTASIVFVHAVKIDDPPARVIKPGSCFYGKIAQDLSAHDNAQPLTSIIGMSGGPIFGFKDGRYWLVALQSSWFKEERIVIGCPVLEFGEYLHELHASLESDDTPSA